MIGNGNDVVVFLRRHDAQMPAVIHRAEDDVVRERIQFLDSFAMYVLVRGRAEGIYQPRAADCPRDDADCQREIAQQPRKFTGCLRMRVLRLCDIPLDCNEFF